LAKRRLPNTLSLEGEGRERGEACNVFLSWDKPR